MNFRKLAPLALALAGIAFAAPAGAVTEIRTAIGAPPKHPMVNPGHTWYSAAVEEASRGQIKFRSFYGGQLFSLRGSLEGLKTGIADLTCLVLPYWPAEFPHGKFVNDIAMLGTDPIAMAGAVAEFNHLNCADCLAEFDRQNSVYMGPYSTDVFYLSGRTRITTLDEFKGKKIRSGGGNWTRWVQALGGVPVSLAGDEIYQGLAGGVLDASVNSVANLQGYSLWDVATDEILLPVGTFHSINLYNFRKDFWQKLSAGERKILMDHVPPGIIKTTLLYIKQAEDVIAPAKARGVRFHEPSPELLKATKDFVIKDLEVVANEAAKFGVEDGKAKLDKLLALVGKWEKLSRDAGRDEAKLTAILNREIYSKLDSAKHGM